MRRALIILLLITGSGIALAAQEGRDGPSYAGQPLVDVLQDLNRRGLRIVFSTNLVAPALRVVTEPTGSPREVLDQVLRPHGLQARSGPQGTLIVARAPRREETPPGIAPRVVRRPVVDTDGDRRAPMATLAGQVRDESGAPIPDTVIAVTAAADGAVRRTTSDAAGRFEMTDMASGRYSVLAERPGLQPAAIPEVVLAAGSSRAVILELKVPGVTELTSVVVARSAPIVDVQNATVATSFGDAMLRDVPNQRDLFALLAQTPGITMPRPDVGGNTAGTQSPYRAYGLAGQSITTVDGVNITAGADAIGAYIDYGALAEATVAAAGNSAEVPVAGAAITTVVKSGGNTPHGELYADLKPGAGARSYEGAEIYRRYRDLNGQLGGPLIKNRLWYFTSFREQYASLATGMSDKPARNGGRQGQPFSTQTTDYTIKLNYQLGHSSTVAFMTQWGRKHQPYRFGSGGAAYLFPVESTALQKSWSEIGKVDYLRVIDNRATLDTSINVWANQFPLKARTDKTPIIDDVSLHRAGAYDMPSFLQDGRWHYNANLSLFADRHDMKIGYMYQRYAPRHTVYGAPGPPGTVGHFYIATTNGVPTSFWTDNGPVWNANVLTNNALFFQDRFQVTPKLTLNYGIRFDRYHSSYPEQRFGVNGSKPCVDYQDCDVGPFAVRAVTPARDVATFNNLVPRVALIYDVFGNSKTAVKASWGRFSTNPAATIAALANPIDFITRKYAWDNAYLTTNPAVGATRITPSYVATLRPIFGGAQLTPTTVDPNLKNSFTDEYTIGAEQEIIDNLRGHVTVVRKRQQNIFGRYDRLRTASAFSPVRAVDPGPDGILRGERDDDRVITVWETQVPPGVTDFYLTNKAIGDSYDTVEIGVTKRMSDHWQLTSGVDWTTRNLSSLFSEDPNTVAWNSNNTRLTGWTLKASGSYLFNYGILVGLSYNAMKGEPYGRFLTVTEPLLRLADPNRTAPLVQGNMTIVAEKAGTYYYPAIHLLSVRAQKEFAIKDSHRLDVMFNVFNLADVETVTSVIQTTGTLFNDPTAHITGAVVRVSARYTF